MMDTTWLAHMMVIAIPLVISLTVHEVAHARTALAFGDPTAQRMGRCSFNPLVHLDRVGTIVMLLTGGFGWAKPVPVNPYNLHPRRLGNIMVSLAGPLSNVGLAIIVGVAMRVMAAVALDPSIAMVQQAYGLLARLFVANLCLAAFNMLPLWPLDGHHIQREMMSADGQIHFMQWQRRYAPIILVALLVGPAILEMVTNRRVFDPLRWVLLQAVNLGTHVLGLPADVWYSIYRSGWLG